MKGEGTRGRKSEKTNTSDLEWRRRRRSGVPEGVGVGGEVSGGVPGGPADHLPLGRQAPHSPLGLGLAAVERYGRRGTRRRSRRRPGEAERVGDGDGRARLSLRERKPRDN